MVFDVFINFFTNPINISFMAMFVMVGVIIGYLYQPSPKNQVLYCREKDGRGQELKIQSEDAVSLETKSNPALRFFKYGRSYVFTIARKFGKAKKVARFFGKEGTAYTWTLEGWKEGKKVKDSKDPKKESVIEKAKKIKVNFKTLENAVKHTWGKKFYNTVPEAKKKLLRNNKMLVTVNLETGLTPSDYEPISEMQIRKKANEDMAGLIARGIKGILKKSALDVLPWIGTGVAIGLAIVALGLLKVGTCPPCNSVTRNMITLFLGV